MSSHRRQAGTTSTHVEAPWWISFQMPLSLFTVPSMLNAPNFLAMSCLSSRDQC